MYELSLSHTNTLDNKTREFGTPYVMLKIPFDLKGRLEANLVKSVILFCKEFSIYSETLNLGL